MRSVLTAARAGASDVLLVVPPALGDRFLQKLLQRVSRRGLRINLIQIRDFDPRGNSSWIILKRHLKNKFLWLPWNWITTKAFLSQLPLVDIGSVDWSKAAYATEHELVEGASSALPPRSAGGVAVTSPESAVTAERFLVANSGKVLDGIHTSFNRRLCWPFVRLLSHTPVTPNAITFGGVVISILSAIAFAHGTYLWSVLGAFLFYIAGLFDEMDGMVARIKFAESPSGTWLEGMADGLSYLLLFAGITIGLSRQYGRLAVWMGLALLTGSVLALIATSLQRRRATAPDRPNEYLGRFYQLLQKDSGNWISRVVRQVQAFQRRGILIHYIVIFTVIGALPLVFLLATLGAHLTWILILYFNRRFFSQSSEVNPTVSKAKEAL
ncbi:MAG TPA: CDP-alcohol phosphatidyltransferase family protein [Candidatus Dormibacteraeota bacterium]|nr:CDP-alcohol phosphatidyltransferase family protein [Candidatus Dormibacteraeota bacterium]